MSKSKETSLKISREEYVDSVTPFPIDGSVIPKNEQNVVKPYDDQEFDNNPLIYTGPDFSQ